MASTGSVDVAVQVETAPVVLTLPATAPPASVTVIADEVEAGSTGSLKVIEKLFAVRSARLTDRRLAVVDHVDEHRRRDLATGVDRGDRKTM